MNIEYGNNRDMKVNSTQILVLRRQKLWSQQHLAEVSGLSLRTIQRVENQSKGSRETITALASVFDLNAAELLVQEKPYPVTDASETKLSVPPSTKIVAIFALFFSAFATLIWVPTSVASDVQIKADESSFDEPVEHFDGNVEIAIPFGFDTSIEGGKMWSAGEASVFEGNVNVDIDINDRKHFKFLLQNAVVVQTEEGISISADNAVLFRLDNTPPPVLDF